MAFLDVLPAELRNRIYELAMPSEYRNGHLVICSPPGFENTTSAVQPAITQISRQVRAETLDLFYANNKFAAQISRFDFLELIRFVDCITAGLPSPRKMKIHVHLMHNMCTNIFWGGREMNACYRGLIDFAIGWSILNFDTIHLEIKSGMGGNSKKNPRQSRLVKEAITVAENMPTARVESRLRRYLSKDMPAGTELRVCKGPCNCRPISDREMERLYLL